MMSNDVSVTYVSDSDPQVSRIERYQTAGLSWTPENRGKLRVACALLKADSISVISKIVLPPVDTLAVDALVGRKFNSPATITRTVFDSPSEDAVRMFTERIAQQLAAADSAEPLPEEAHLRWNILAEQTRRIVNIVS